METIIVVGIVISALYFVIRGFTKLTEGKGDCHCSQQCSTCNKTEVKNYG